MNKNKMKKKSSGLFYRLKIFVSGPLFSTSEDTIKDSVGFKEILTELWKWVLSTLMEREELKIKSEGN